MSHSHESQHFFFKQSLRCHLSRAMRKTDFCLCENKGADQLRTNCEADQRLCFRYTDAQSFLLRMYRPVCVRPDRKPRRPVFSRRGSLYKISDSSARYRFSGHLSRLRKMLHPYCLCALGRKPLWRRCVSVRSRASPVFQMALETEVPSHCDLNY